MLRTAIDFGSSLLALFAGGAAAFFLWVAARDWRPRAPRERAGVPLGIPPRLSQRDREQSRRRQPLEILYPGPPADVDTKATEVDVIAVHGLGSSVDWSWVWKDGDRNIHWLRDHDMLPAKVPKARIIAYNYDSRWHSNAPKTRLQLCGEELVHSLHLFRDGAFGRPIVFIGHSLGGLVIQHALLYAESREELRDLVRHTVGFVSLGTPFRGTKMQSIADFAAQFMVLAGSQRGIIRDLTFDNETLRDQLQEFCQLCKRLYMPTCCFFELYKTDYGKRYRLPGLFRGMVVGEESACVPGWDRYPLPTDHLKMNKFSSPQDRSFEFVSDRIRTMCDNSKIEIERRKSDIPTRNVITVTEFSRTEAEEMLRNNLKESQTHDSSSTTGLLDFLADLPLAIKQASAYMAKTGVSTAKYLHYCQSSNDNVLQLLSMDFEDRGRYKSIENAVATTWLISFKHISRDNQLAAEYLRFMCFLADKGIPASLLPQAEDEITADEALGILKAFAFIVEREEPGTYDMHRLVRLSTLSWLAKDGERGEWADKVLQRLVYEFPHPDHGNRGMCMRYLPHARQYLEYATDAEDEEARLNLLSKAANSLDMLGQYQEAEQIFRQELKLSESVLGKEHPDTLTSMNNLADSQGKYDEAEQMNRQTLRLMETMLGKDHPDTLTSMNNLALVLKSQGKYEEAESMHRQELKLSESVLGKDHPDTLTSMGNLALVLDSQGKYDEAEQMHRQTLRLREAVLGKEHPNTLTSVNNLAA
ncbi:Kinesin light chain 1 [Tolypocladium ophioglossoides CBS 100239]|uniref:Kinesin light chain 1 n=1 Tax=Tolypocladium ophioglossoides (strain CBS 100239) TaxID=1163406 RepID=A0A0L0NCA2_TOLOC|nr:Kinesin light chain 1 [Tolypocladium ophioglossoides CBS 100239]